MEFGNTVSLNRHHLKFENFIIFRGTKRKIKDRIISVLDKMEEEKEVSVEKEIKERANKIAASLSNDHNIITFKGKPNNNSFLLRM